MDANVRNVTASTSKNTQDSDKVVQDFFQPQLNHNSARSRVITASIACFIAKDLRPYIVVESDGFRNMVR